MSAQSSIKLLGISGSLRKQSYNSGALNAIGSLLPDGMTFMTADLSSLPFYSADIEQRGLPDAVQRFRAEVAAAGCTDLCRAGVQFFTFGGPQECARMAFTPAYAPHLWKALRCIRCFRKSAGHCEGTVSFSSRGRFAQYDHGGMCRTWTSTAPKPSSTLRTASLIRPPWKPCACSSLSSTVLRFNCALARFVEGYGRCGV